MSSQQIPSIVIPSTYSFTILGPDVTLVLADRLEALACGLSSLREPCDHGFEAVECLTKLVCLLFPEFSSEFTRMLTVKVDTRVVPVGIYKDSFGSGEGDQASVKDRLPVVRAALDSALESVTMEPVVSGLGVLLFTLGRPFSVSNPGQYTTSRPSAYIGKYKLSPPRDKFMPSKECGPSLAFVQQLSEAYVQFPEIRATITRLFISQMSQPFTSPEMNCCLTTFKLLPGSQMAHVQAILECLQANPWIVKMPQLRPHLAFFAGEMKKLAQFPPELRAYNRLLSSDHNVLFNRNAMRPLVAVCVEWKADVDPTFKEYQGKEAGYSALVDEFRARASTVGGTELTDDNLPELLGVPSATLPQITTRTRAGAGLL